MRFKKVEDGFLLRFERGERIMEGMARFAKENAIPHATVTGLGALMNTELGFYHLHRKEYDRRQFAAEAELVNLTGNITWLEEKPVVHCHVTIGNEQFEANAGHLFEAECAVTVEVFLSVRDTRIARRFSDEVGLNLQDL